MYITKPKFTNLFLCQRFYASICLLTITHLQNRGVNSNDTIFLALERSKRRE